MKNWITTYKKEIRFCISFILLFCIFYYFNLFYIGITAEGGFYVPFLAAHLNYIEWWRDFLLWSSKLFIQLFGYEAINYRYIVHVVGGASVQLVYSCLGYGIISFYTAFIVAYPDKIWNSKIKFFFILTIFFTILNIMRIGGLALIRTKWPRTEFFGIDHHTIFNIIAYIIIFLLIRYWIKK